MIKFDSEDFTINESMIRTPKPHKILIRNAIFPIISLLFFIFGGLISMLQFWFYLIVTCLIFYVLLKISPRIVSDYAMKLTLPVVMKQMDNALKKIKTEQLKNISGKVLDVGCATGLYLPYYVKSNKKVTELVALEPNSKLLPGLKANLKKNGLESITKIANIFVEELEYPENYFDSVVLGNVLCEIPDHDSVLNSINKYLKPGGRVYYIEHVLENEGYWERTIQKNINWWWRVVAGGCNCNKESLKSLLKQRTWKNQNWPIHIKYLPPHIRKLDLGICVKEK